jgi:RNA polymerase sigma factor (sigma-70 family)
LVEELRSSNRRQDILKLLYKEGTVENHAEQSLIDYEERQSIQKDILSAMNHLTDRQKEAIFLKYNKDFSYQEIAELLGIDKASVCTLLYRSIKIMRRAFMEKAVPIQI